MLLEKIILQGFLSYRKKQEIDLSLVSSCLVLGRVNNDPEFSNGAGKSSLFEAIPVNFFGKGSGRAGLLDSYINDNMSEMRIEIIFKIDNQRYQSIRSKTRGSSGDFEIFYDTTNLELKDATWKKCDKTIEEILGLSSKTFSSTIYLNERESLQVITGTSSERKEILRELLNIDIYEKCSKFCSKRHDEFDRKVQVNINMIQDKQEKLEQEPATKQKLKTAELNLKNLKKTLKEKEKELKEKNEEKQKLHVKIETENLVSNQIIQIQKSLIQLQIDLKKSNDDLRQANEEFEEQTERYNQFKESIKSSIKRKPLVEKIINQQEKVLKKIDQADSELKLLLKEAKKVSEEKTQAEKDLAIVKNETKHIQAFLDNLEKFGNVCPVTELECQVLKGEYKQSLSEDKIKELTEKEKKIEELNVHIQQLLLSLRSYTKQEQELDTVCDSRQAENEKLSEAKLELQKILNGENTFSEKEKEFNEYSKEVEKEKVDISKNSENIKKKITEQKNEIEELEKKIDPSLQKKMDTLLKETQEIENCVSDLNDEYDDQNQHVGELKSQVLEFEKIKSDIKHLNKNNEENMKQKKINQSLTMLFGKDGIQKSVMKESIPLLEEYTKEFLKIFNEDSENIKVKFDLDPKRQDGEFKKGGGLDILVLEEGKEPKDLQMYSGGETVRIVFSIVLSLAKLLSLRAGKKHETLIIDEKIAKLDSRGIIQFGEVISEISKIYKQVFVITHIDSLKNLINGNEIIVNKTIEEGSQVVVL